jgi:hypothetical protein
MTLVIENAVPSRNAARGDLDSGVAEAVTAAHSRYLEGQPDHAVLLKGLESEKAAKALLYQVRQYVKTRPMGIVVHKRDIRETSDAGWTLKVTVQNKRGSKDGSAGDNAASA